MTVLANQLIEEALENERADQCRQSSGESTAIRTDVAIISVHNFNP